MSVPIPLELVDALRAARAVVVLTGAGISAESGIATFRDAMDGLWAKFDPSELATPEAFARDPAMVTRWYDERRLRCAKVRPNPGHQALAKLEQELAREHRSFMLITQNVDRLHQKAGSVNVVELHGSIWVWRCVTCGVEKEYRGGAFDSYPPACGCGGVLRPGVVWFGESLPAEAIRASEKALAACDLFFSVGTSSVVFPAADFIHAAQAAGARTVEVNLEPTPVSHLADWSIFGKAGEVLPFLVAEKAAKQGD